MEEHDRERVGNRERGDNGLSIKLQQGLLNWDDA